MLEKMGRLLAATEKIPAPHVNGQSHGHGARLTTTLENDPQSVIKDELLGTVRCRRRGLACSGRLANTRERNSRQHERQHTKKGDARDNESNSGDWLPFHDKPLIC